MFDRLLVPTDRSDPARRALLRAVALANRYGATVHVLAVVDTRELDSATDLDERRADVASQLEGELDGLDVDHPPETAVRAGIPHEAILDYASEADVDLVVMGTHGRTSVSRYLLGSVAEKVVRLSDRPVLTVHPDEAAAATAPFERLLVPTDGSEGSEVAVEYATDLASTYGAAVHAVSVVDTGAMGPDVSLDLVVDELRARAIEAVEGVAAAATEAGVERTRTSVLEGQPHAALSSYIEEAGIDLVVMGTHGRSGVDRYLLGSVAEKLVRTVSVPVLTVRMPPESG